MEATEQESALSAAAALASSAHLTTKGHQRVAHLAGRRTGRRAGSRSRPPWLRAVRWAHENLGKPDAVPPSALARLLVEQARQNPDRLVVCFAKAEEYEREMERTARRQAIAQAAAAAPFASAPGKPVSAFMPRKMRRLEIGWADVNAWLKSHRAPAGAKVIGCDADGDGRILVTVTAETTLTIDRWSVQHLIAAQPRVLQTPVSWRANSTGEA